MALLLCATNTLGFSPFSGGGGLAPRSSDTIVECDPESAAKCAEMGSRMAFKKNGKPNTKVCLYNGFCYWRSGNYHNCETYASGCNTPGSEHCSTHTGMVEKGSCPARGPTGTSDFCTELADFTPLRPDRWCGGVDDKTECDVAYITYETAGKEMFQRCAWNEENEKKGKAPCQPYEEDGYDVGAFCSPFCKKLGTSATVNLGDQECNQGRYDDLSAGGLPARLSDKAVCEASYYEPTTAVYQGCEWLQDTERCSPAFFTAEFPACNCQPYLTDACAAIDISCCNSDGCADCEARGVEYDITIYQPFVPPVNA